MRRTSDDVIYANVSWFSDGITPETVTWWGCLAGKVIFFLFLFFSLLSIYTIRVCKRVRSPVTKGRPNGRDLCHSQGRAAELLKSSRVLFSGSSSILFPRLFFFFLLTTVPLARPASGVCFSHTCFTPRLCCC